MSENNPKPPDKISGHDYQPENHQASEKPTLLTRQAVADRLGVSIFKVRCLERSELSFQLIRGTHFFDLKEVARFEKGIKRRPKRTGQTEGEIAAIVFRAFAKGKDLHQIVTSLKVTPAKVRDLYREWCSPDLEEHEVRLRRKEARKREAEKQRIEDVKQREHEERMRNWTT